MAKLSINNADIAESDSINLVSYMDTDTLEPLVAWWIGGSYLQPFDPDTAVHGFYSLKQAKDIAHKLFTAAAIAQAEATIVKMFLALSSNAKGFGKKATQSEQAASVMLLESRKHRQAVDLGPHIKPIFGMKTRKALIDVTLYPVECQWEPEYAAEHATKLLQVAEASVSDAFLTNFLTTKIDVSLIDARAMVQEFKVYRQQQTLEELLNK